MTNLLNQVVLIATQAGQQILDVYNSDDFNVEVKGDGSPLTLADRRAHQLIESALSALTPDIPILSEESADDAFAARRGWSRFWLVDPLDGTKEFVKRNGEFTVNIALIDQGKPIMGVVHTPVQQQTHYAAQKLGAFKATKDGEKKISVANHPLKTIKMVASRSHRGEAVEQYMTNLQQNNQPVEIVSMGSSLKLCLIAEGAADIYPRLGPTSEWDTAAAHCVVDCAGGKVVRLDGAPLVYNKENILNPWFLACGHPEFDWVLPASGIAEPTG